MPNKTNRAANAKWPAYLAKKLRLGQVCDSDEEGKTMKRTLAILIISAALLHCSAEENKQNSDVLTSSDLQFSVSGKSAWGTAGDQVCLDLDSSFYCDGEEPATTLKADLTYTISTPVVSNLSHVLVNATDGGDPNTTIVMASVQGRMSYVSILTTYVNLELEKDQTLTLDQAIEKVRNRFDLPAGIQFVPSVDTIQPGQAGATFTLAQKISGKQQLSVPTSEELQAIDSNEVLRRAENALKGALIGTAVAIVLPPALATYVVYQFFVYGNIRPFATCYPANAAGKIQIWFTWNGERGIDGITHDACSCKKYLWGPNRHSSCDPLFGLSKTTIGPSSFTYQQMTDYVNNKLALDEYSRKFKVQAAYQAINIDEFKEKYAEALSTEGLAAMLSNGITLISNYFKSAYSNLTSYEKTRAKTRTLFNELFKIKSAVELPAALLSAAGTDSFNTSISAYFTACSAISDTCKIPFHHADPVVVENADINNSVTITGKFEYGFTKYGAARKDATAEKVAAFYIDVDATTPTWKSFGTSTTSASNETSGIFATGGGNITFELPAADKVAGHTYLVKMVLLADGSEVLSQITLKSN